MNTDTVKNRGTRVADNMFDRIQIRNGVGAKAQSQMDRVVSALQSSGKPLEDDASIATRLEARVAKLATLQEELKKIHGSLSELYVLEPPRQLKRITSSMRKIEAMIANKPPVGVSKFLKVTMNELTSLREGVYIGAATKKKSLVVLSVGQAVTALAEMQNTSAARKEKITAAGKNDDGLYTDDALRVIKDSEHESKKLDGIHKKDFVVCRVPVIPVAKSFLTADALKRKGFKVENLGGYAVMHNQIVIGVSKVMLEMKDGENSKIIKPERFLAAAEQVRKMLSKQLGRKLVFVSESPYGAQGGAWFWVMGENELNLFASAFPGKRVQMTRWGFAF